jgi:hypothetical protein
VAKYINAPTTDVKKFEKTELPPTRAEIHSFWYHSLYRFAIMSRSKKKSGSNNSNRKQWKNLFCKIPGCHCPGFVFFFNLSKIVITLNAIIPTSIGTRGRSLSLSISEFESKIVTIVTIAAPATTAI